MVKERETSELANREEKVFYPILTMVFAKENKGDKPQGQTRWREREEGEAVK